MLYHTSFFFVCLFSKVIWNVYSFQNIGAKTLNKTWHLLFNNHRLENQERKEIIAIELLTAIIEAYITTEALGNKSTILLGLMEERFRRCSTEDDTPEMR